MWTGESLAKSRSVTPVASGCECNNGVVNGQLDEVSGIRWSGVRCMGHVHAESATEVSGR